MTSNSLLIIFALLVLSLSKDFKVSAQEWEKLVPMVSTCKDVRKLLGVKKCEPPISDYNFPEYKLSIDVAGKDNPWKVSEGTVIQVLAEFVKKIKLEDYEKANKNGLRDFREIPNTVLLNDNLIYYNEKQGIFLIIVTIDNCKWIEAIQLVPDEKRRHYDK